MSMPLELASIDLAGPTLFRKSVGSDHPAEPMFLRLSALSASPIGKYGKACLGMVSKIG